MNKKILKRQKRFEDFKEFFDHADELFKNFNNKYKKHIKLRKMYVFSVDSVCNYNQYGLSSVIVYFKNRNFYNFKTPENNQNIENEEVGPKLHYSQMVNGNILIRLYPAHTNIPNIKRNIITIDYLKNTVKLIKSRYLKKHFKYLISYLAVTSIDYEPNLIDKIRLFYLRYFKRFDHNIIISESKMKIFSKEFLLIVITAFVSAFLTFIIPFVINYKGNKLIGQTIRSVANNLYEITNTLSEFKSGAINYFYINMPKETTDELKLEEDE